MSLLTQTVVFYQQRQKVKFTKTREGDFRFNSFSGVFLFIPIKTVQ